MKCSFVELNLNRAAIDERFNIFKIAISNGEQAQSLAQEIKESPNAILAVSYGMGQNDHNLYLLVDKNEAGLWLVDFERKKGFIVVKINARDKASIYDNVLGQLLLNSLQSTRFTGKYGNIEGNLIFFLPNWQRTEKKKFYRYGLKIRLNYGQSLDVSVITFKESEKGSYFWNDLDCTMTKQQCLTGKAARFEVKGDQNTRNLIEYFSVNNITAFDSSKNGIITNLLVDVENELGPFMKLRLHDLETSKRIEKKEQRENLLQEIRNQFQGARINFIDLTKTQAGSDLIRKFALRLQREVPDLTVTFNPEVLDGYNLCYLLPKAAYSKGEDPYLQPRANAIIQHFTRDASIEKMVRDDRPLFKQATVIMILLELIAKREVIEKRISPSRLAILAGNLPLTVAIVEGRGDQQQFVSVRIETEGQLIFSKWAVAALKEEKTAIPEEWAWLVNDLHDQKMPIEKFVKNLWKIETLLCFKDGTVATIEKTPIRLAADGQKFRPILANVRKRGIPKKHLLTAIEQAKQEKITKETKAKLDELEIVLSEFPRRVDMIDLKDFIKGNTTVGKRLNEIIRKEYNYQLFSNLRVEKLRHEYDCFYNIHLFKEVPFDKWFAKKGRNSLYYAVGAPKGSLKLDYERACLVRQISYSGTGFAEDFFLKMLEVDFIRIGNYTVLPFPVKYLRTYCVTMKE